jgi:hypothetical protein
LHPKVWSCTCTQALSDHLADDAIQNEQFAILATVNVSLVHVVSGLNEMHRVVTGILGQKERGGLFREQG